MGLITMSLAVSRLWRYAVSLLCSPDAKVRSLSVRRQRGLAQETAAPRPAMAERRLVRSPAVGVIQSSLVLRLCCRQDRMMAASSG